MVLAVVLARLRVSQNVGSDKHETRFNVVLNHVFSFLSFLPLLVTKGDKERLVVSAQASEICYLSINAVSRSVDGPEGR